MAADQLLGLAAGLEDLGALDPLLDPRDVDGFALGAHHREGVVGLEGVGLAPGLQPVQAGEVLAALHLGVVFGGAGAGGEPGRQSEGEGDAGPEEGAGSGGLHLCVLGWVVVGSAWGASELTAPKVVAGGSG